NDGVHGRELWMAATDGGGRGGSRQRSLGESVRAGDPRHVLKAAATGEGGGGLNESVRNVDPRLGVGMFLAAARSVPRGQPALPSTTAVPTATEVAPQPLDGQHVDALFAGINEENQRAALPGALGVRSFRTDDALADGALLTLLEET